MKVMRVMRMLGWGLIVFQGLTAGAAPAAPKAKKAPPAPIWESIAVEPTVAQALLPVFGTNAGKEWSTQPTRKGTGMIFTLIQDGQLGLPAVKAEGRTQVLRREWAGEPFEIEYYVKFEGDKGASLNLLLYPREETSAPPALLNLSLRAAKGQMTVSAFKDKGIFKSRAYDTILPMWPDFVRIPMEQDMATLPDIDHRWFQVRVSSVGGRIQVWVDDRFISEQTFSGADAVRRIELRIAGEIELAGWTLKNPPVTDPAYTILPLDGYVRDRQLRPKGVALADSALPFGQKMDVGGVPFQLVRHPNATSPDHIDVGRSLIRQGTMEGYFPATDQRLGNAFTPDPARIQLRLPQDQYDTLYVLAAFDEEPDSIPLFSAAFYRPKAGFHEIFEGQVPGLTADPKQNANCMAVPVKLTDGSAARLWRVAVPLDPARLADFSDLDAVELELTKKMAIYRSFPDPINYGWHGAGLPSGVRIYALTLHRAAVEVQLTPDVFGHVWTDPAVPAYHVGLTNRTGVARTVRLTAETVSYDGREKTTQTQTKRLASGGGVDVPFKFKVTRNGLHTLTLRMETEGVTERQEVRYFARLAKDTRAPFWEEGQGPLFGYWSYQGGHDTPPATDIMRVMYAAGARAVPHAPQSGEARQLYDEWKWRDVGVPRAINVYRDWNDPVKTEAFSNNTTAAIRKYFGDSPELVTFYAEPAISRELTAGNPPEYWGDPSYVMNGAESNSLANFMQTSRYVSEIVRANWPKAKVLIPWGDPLFVVPMLRAGFPRNLVDGSGLDMIGFERLPEQQIHQMSTHRLYILREEFRKAGITNPLLAYVEGTFEPTEPGALTWDEQAERYHRWTLISLAYGVDRFYSGWFAYDCGDYYGAEHYGGCGIQRRIPYSDPKPAYAHYATLTRQLDRSHFAGWLPTGSHSVYALKFDRPTGPVHVFWTVRGRRPVELELELDAKLQVTDAMDNTDVLPTTGRRATLTVGTSPVYVSGVNSLKVASLGGPDHSDSVVEARTRDEKTWRTGLLPPEQPVAVEKTIARLGDGQWTLAASARDEVYEQNNFDTKRFPGAMTATVTNDPGRPEPALAIHLEAQERERQLMPWYSILKPVKPVEVPGKAVALGLWVKAASDWGRVVYNLKDAQGERWISIGTKDQWNCNDPHGWSMFNFDGWRYLRFELPANSPYDRYRESGTVWWGHFGGDGIVDLPVKLESIIVERRTHVLYVNDIQPANPADVLLGDLVAEYATEADATPAALKLDRIRRPLPRNPAALANPIADLAAQGTLPAVTLEKVTMPDWGYDGTRAHVHFNEMPDAKEYQVWVAAYPDGRGAVKIGTMKKSGGLVNNLRPAMKLYLWVTYSTAASPAKGKKAEAGEASRPSNPLEIELVDAFSQK